MIEVKQKSQNSLKHRMWTTVSSVFRAAEERKAALRAYYWNACGPSHFDVFVGSIRNRWTGLMV